MSHRTHRFDAWHLLAEPTFGAILAPAEGEALAEPALERRSAAPGQVKNEQASGAKGAG